MSAPVSECTHRRLVVVGSVNVDLVVRAQRLPGPGETVLGDDVERHGGGKGANAAVAAARAGADVTFVGAVGKDEYGSWALAELEAEGIDTSFVAEIEGVSTGVALIVVDQQAENQIVVAAGANWRLTAQHVHEALLELLGDANCVLVGTEIAGEAVVAAVEDAAKAGVACIINTAPVIPELAQAATFGALLTPNRTEALELLELLGLDAEPETTDTQTRWMGIAQALSGATGAETVITLGAQGAVVAHDAKDSSWVESRPVEALDTTGAGDTFNGVLAASLCRGDRLVDAAKTAGIAASISVTAAGARAGMPRMDAIDRARTEGS
jgi:ribokinase